MKKKPEKHYKRVYAELKEAGMTPYGFTKLETGYLPEIIHENEHVEGVVYGRLEKTIDAVMLVATDKRVLYIDCKPFYRSWDEITYEVVAGVENSTVGPFAGVVLHTRVKDYSIRYVNIKCAKIFTRKIEKYIECQDDDTEKPAPKLKTGADYQPYRMSKHPEIKHSEKHQEGEKLDDTAVLSTVNENGHPHATIVHFEVDKEDNFYILTKKDTQKTRNIEKQNHVSLTIHHSHSLKALYVYGTADIVHDEATFRAVYERIAKTNYYTEGHKLAPITKIAAGEYVVFRITPTDSKLDDYSSATW